MPVDQVKSSLRSRVSAGWSWSESGVLRGNLVFLGGRGAPGLYVHFPSWDRFSWSPVQYRDSSHSPSQEGGWCYGSSTRRTLLYQSCWGCLLDLQFVWPSFCPCRGQKNAWLLCCPRIRRPAFSIQLPPQGLCLLQHLGWYRQLHLFLSAGMWLKKVSKLPLFLGVRNKWYCRVEGVEVVQHRTLPQAITELGGMKSLKNMNKTDLVLSSSKVEGLEESGVDNPIDVMKGTSFHANTTVPADSSVSWLDTLTVSSLSIPVGKRRLLVKRENWLGASGHHRFICTSQAVWREQVYPPSNKRGCYFVTSPFC